LQGIPQHCERAQAFAARGRGSAPAIPFAGFPLGLGSGNAVAVWLHASHNGDIGTEIVQSAVYERDCSRDCRF
jgi:hypothetical protein